MKSEDDFERGLEAINEAFRRALPEKVRQVEDIWRTLQAGHAAPGALRELQRALHSLAGSGRTFGVSGLSEAAAAAEECAIRIEGEPTSDAALRSDFERLLENVRNAASTQ
jgi:chemotaxis protein histidine kinase CheA